MGRTLDVIGVVEACYRVHLREDEWLEGIARAARPFLGKGAAAYSYDASSGTRLDIRASYVPPFLDLAAFMGLLAKVPPEYLRDAWLSRRVGYATDIAGFNEILADGLRAFDGAKDAIAVNGLDPTAHGVWLGAPLWGRIVKSERKLELLDRVSTHLAAAYRMRRALANVSTTRDAVLEPNGDLAHAEGEARERDARDELRRAVVRVERARTKRGRSDGASALSSWRGLVSARWTLVDEFESDGARFIVARKNTVSQRGVGKLSHREAEVLSWAALGHANKVIAYELGISHDTVRVLMHRAAVKLGAKDRRALVAKFVALAT